MVSARWIPADSVIVIPRDLPHGWEIAQSEPGIWRAIAESETAFSVIERFSVSDHIGNVKVVREERMMLLHFHG